MYKKDKKKQAQSNTKDQFFFESIDPDLIRFAHSKIKPVFSCGRRIEDTEKALENGELTIQDLPQITVIQRNDPENKDQFVYYSLNNRRLFLFKSLKKKGLLPGGKVACRVRFIKPNEMDRYTIERCSLQAKFIFGPKSKDDDSSSQGPSDQDSDQDKPISKKELPTQKVAEKEQPIQQKTLAQDLQEKLNLDSDDENQTSQQQQQQQQQQQGQKQPPAKKQPKKQSKKKKEQEEDEEWEKILGKKTIPKDD